MSSEISNVQLSSLATDVPRRARTRPSGLRILVHDYCGHAFPVQLSRELARRGHEVLHTFSSVMQTPRGELIRRDADPALFSVQPVRMDPDYLRYKYSFARRRGMEIRYGHEVGDLIRDWKPELVISGQTPTEAQTSILRSSKSVDARFIYWLQDVYSLAVTRLARRKARLLGPVVGAYYRRLDRQHFRGSDHIVAITHDFITLLTSEFGVERSKISAIPNWAPLDSLPERPKVNSWSREQGLDDKFVFMYTGTLGLKHNPALLLQLAESFHEDPLVRVVVVSEGIGIEWLKEQQTLRNLRNLVLLPFQPFESLPDVLATGDTLISVLEKDAGIFSVPSKVLSYMCARRALLLAVPEANLAARIVREQDAGIVVSPTDQSGFVEAAQRLRTDPSLRSEIAKHARDYADSNFQVSEIAEKFECAAFG